MNTEQKATEIRQIITDTLFDKGHRIDNKVVNDIAILQVECVLKLPGVVSKENEMIFWIDVLKELKKDKT